MKHLIKNGQIVQSGIPRRFTRENGQVFLGGYQNMTDLHYEDGWREEVLPEFDSSLFQLGNPFYDEEQDKVSYSLYETPFDLEDKQKQLLAELEIAEDDMERLISRCERVNGRDNEGLNTVIATILQVQRDTRTAIPLLTEEQARIFRIKKEDIDFLKSLLQPYKVPVT